MFSCAALAVSVVLAAAASTQGQGRHPRAPVMPRPIQVMPIQLEGTVAGVQPGMVALATAAGETWALKIPPKAEVRVTGTAEPDVLQPGMFVRFIAPVDKRRSLVQEKVGKLVVFSPSQEAGRMLGVFHPSQDADGAAAQLDPDTPPEAPAGRNPGARPKAAPARKGANPQDRTAPEVETLDVRGRLTGVKGRWLTVSPPRNTFFKRTLRIELTEKPEIEVDVNTYTLAKLGDKISAQCVQIAPQAAQAMKVAIQLAEPLSKSGKKAGRSAGKRPARGPQKPGEDRQPFEVAPDEGPDEPDRARESPPQEKPEGPEKPGPQGERSRQIVEFLQAKREDVKGKPGVTLKLATGDPLTFEPCKGLPWKEALERFGRPDQMQTIKGSLALVEGGQPKEIQWQLWIYGPVMFFVDEAGTTRYLAVMADKRKQPKQQVPPQQEQQAQTKQP